MRTADVVERYSDRFPASKAQTAAELMGNVEGIVHAVAGQTRVATARAETPTDGHATFDLTAGFEPYRRVELGGGILNAFDESYVNHLNSKNPFTGAQIPDPGRVFFGRVSYSF